MKSWEQVEAEIDGGEAAMTPEQELLASALGFEEWLAARPDSAEVRSAMKRVAEMRRFAEEGRGDVWRRELAASTQLALVSAGYLPLLDPDNDVLEGIALREVAERIFKDA